MVTEWISCKERQPEARGTYLTVDMDTEFPHVRTLDYSAKWHGWNCVESADDEQEAKKWEMNITHWMALPDLPEVDAMKREAWYRFTFEDGFSVICMGLSPIMAGKYKDEHGRITNKEFVAWEDELTVGHILGGKNNAAAND